MVEETLKHYLRLRDDEIEGLKVVDSRTVYLQKNIENRQFQLTGILHATDTQEKVYETVGKRGVEKFLEGYASMFFFYGANETGKIYTMLGDVDHLDDVIEIGGVGYDQRGLVVRSMQQIFRKAKALEKQKQFRVFCSCMQISTTRIGDLHQKDLKKRLRIQEDESGWFKANMQQTHIKNMASFVQYLRGIFSARQCQNSHLVFEISLIQSDVQGAEEVQSYITFVELGFVMYPEEEEEQLQMATELGSLSKVLCRLNNLESMGNVFKESRLSKVLKQSICNSYNITVIGTVGKDNSHIENSQTISFLRQTKDSSCIDSISSQNNLKRISQRSANSRVSFSRQDTILSDKSNDNQSSGVESSNSLKKRQSYLQLTKQSGGYKKAQYLMQQKAENDQTIRQLQMNLEQVKQGNQQLQKKYKDKRDQLTGKICSLRFTCNQLKDNEATVTRVIVQKYQKFLEELNAASRQNKQVQKLETRGTLRNNDDRHRFLDYKEEHKKSMRATFENRDEMLKTLKRQHSREVLVLSSNREKLSQQVSPLNEMMYKQTLRQIQQLDRHIRAQQRYVKSIEVQNVDKFRFMQILNSHKYKSSLVQQDQNVAKMVRQIQNLSFPVTAESFSQRAIDHLKSEMFNMRLRKQRQFQMGTK